MTQYTIIQAADIMQQSCEAVRKYILTGKLKATKDGRRYVISKADLYEFLIQPLKDAKQYTGPLGN